MSAVLSIRRAAPLTTLQDMGRPGMLRHGISASGPMDRSAYLAPGGGRGGIEFTRAGLELAVISGACRAGWAGGDFTVHHNGAPLGWPGAVQLQRGDVLAITPGARGNYGYLRFDAALDLPESMGSIATSSRARLGGLEGRALREGDELALVAGPLEAPMALPAVAEGPIRIVWGLHADLFAPELRQRFLEAEFVVSGQMDRMGVRLEDGAGVFAGASKLSLVSDAIVPGDIQILGDGTPIVLMRDHQPTGGYPRIATLASVDFDRFAQMRAGSRVGFAAVSLDHAHKLLRSRA